jgi:hypothetical protein
MNPSVDELFEIWKDFRENPEKYNDEKKHIVPDISLKKVTEQILLRCCDLIDNQIVSTTGWIVCFQCGREFHEDDVYGKIEEEYDNDNYSKRGGAPYSRNGNMKRHFNYLKGRQTTRTKHVDMDLMFINDIQLAKKIMKEKGCTDYKHVYKLTGCTRIPLYMIDIFHLWVFEYIRIYNDIKVNKKKFFTKDFFCRQVLIILDKWWPQANFKQWLFLFPQMKHRKSEDVNVDTFCKGLSLIDLTYIEDEMFRILVADPNFVDSIAIQNSLMLNPAQMDLERNRQQMVNDLRRDKLPEHERLDRLQFAPPSLKLLDPVSEIELQVDSSSAETNRALEKIGSSASLPVVNHLGGNQVNGQLADTPLKNVNIVDTNSIIPADSVVGLRQRLEAFKQAHEESERARLTVQKSQTLINHYVHNDRSKFHK